MDEPNLVVSPKYQFLHSTTYRDKNNECVVAVIKDVNSGEIHLEYIHNPKRRIYVYRPHLRQRQNRKDLCADMNEVDEYMVVNKDLRTELSDILYGKGFSGYSGLRNLINSPYVFGADIDIAVLIKQSYYNRYQAVSDTYRMGCLDIETNVVPEYSYSHGYGDEIIIMTYCSPEMGMYIGILNQFLTNGKIKHTAEEVRERIYQTLKEYQEELNEDAKKVYDKYINKQELPKVTIEVFDTELQLIMGCAAFFHKDKPEYIGIWNINFDAPRIKQRIEALGGDPRDFFCHPDVPKQFRHFKYTEDTRDDLQIPQHAWHVLEATGYSWWYDAMGLYARLGKFDGVEDSYSLDAISRAHLGVGKKEIDTHYVMQTADKVNYCAYAVIDSVNPAIMEQMNNDLGQMHTLMAYSDLPSFAQQTVQLKYRFFDYCKHHHKVSSSQMGKILMPGDEEIINEGGNVLEPGLAWRAGVNKVRELIQVGLKNLKSKLQFMVNDIDVTFCLKENIGVA